jgi:HD-GYP domain-containing protein (c-di-GMP phosphodiesterase class II)
VFVPGHADDTSISEQERLSARLARKSMLLWVGAVAAFACLATVLAIGFVNQERDAILQQWQIRLGIVADSRAGAVAHWLDSQFATLRDLAQNPSLQIYASGLSAQAAGAGTEMAEAAYLRNLLTATAQRNGFVASRPRQQINANVPSDGTSGLAVLDAQGKTLVATAGMPAMSDAMREAMDQARQGSPGLADIHPAAQGLPVIGFTMPVYSVQGSSIATAPAGFVVGLKEVDSDLFSRLTQPGDTSATAETYLVRRSGDDVIYLSPLADGTPPLHRQLSIDTPQLADAFAVISPGGFAERRDYRGHDVLVTSRRIAGAPWIVVRKIDRQEALAGTTERLAMILAGLILAVLVAVALAVALWRHGTSVRLASEVSRNRAMVEELGRTARFLQVLTDAQPTEIATFDAQGRYTFANQRAAAAVHSSPAAILGKTMVDVLGPHRAQRFQELNDVALAEKRLVSWTNVLGEGTPSIVHSLHVPLEQGDGDVLMVVQDVTDLLQARHRTESALEALVTVLVTILDSLVPYWAHHSARVSEVARGIAQEMEADRNVARTAELAGRLLNVGVLLVPAEILLKPGELVDAELDIIHRKVLDTAEMLKGVEFDLPVVETLMQSQEWWDGSGYPNGLKGDDISQAARIVAVARSYVSLTSPRSYRDARSPEEACDLLTSQAGQQFDRRVVAALVHYLFNRGGMERTSRYLAEAGAAQ